jgi:haloacetate dehalogenase
MALPPPGAGAFPAPNRYPWHGAAEREARRMRKATICFPASSRSGSRGRRTAGVGRGRRPAGRTRPLLLLHGFPQNHAMWHRLAPALAETHRVIALDLKGYGWSAAPDSRGGGERLRKQRRLGAEIVAGDASASAMCASRWPATIAAPASATGSPSTEPGRIERLAILDIVPTDVQWTRIEAKPGANPHLAVPGPPRPGTGGGDPPRPGRLFRGAAARAGARGAADLAAFDARALTLYRQAWNVPERIHAMCEITVRAAPTDRTAPPTATTSPRDGTLAMPVLVLRERVLSRSRQAGDRAGGMAPVPSRRRRRARGLPPATSWPRRRRSRRCGRCRDFLAA